MAFLLFLPAKSVECYVCENMYVCFHAAFCVMNEAYNTTWEEEEEIEVEEEEIEKGISKVSP